MCLKVCTGELTCLFVWLFEALSQCTCVKYTHIIRYLGLDARGSWTFVFRSLYFTF